MSLVIIDEAFPVTQNYNQHGSGGGYLVGSQDSPGQDTKVRQNLFDRFIRKLLTRRFIQKSASHAVRPVTILALLNATQAHTDAPFTVDGMEFGQVCLL